MKNKSLYIVDFSEIPERDFKKKKMEMKMSHSKQSQSEKTHPRKDNHTYNGFTSREQTK